MYLTTGKLDNGMNFYVRYLTIKDLPEVINLQSKVVQGLPEPDVLQPLTTEEFTRILKDRNLMIGVFVDERMIAFRAMLAPEKDEEGLGADIGLKEEKFGTIIYSEISNVDPDYRGNGLQTYMGKILVNNIDDNRYRYILATVAPFNIASLKDKFALGMEIAVLKEKFGGKLRYVFKKDLNIEAQTVPTKEIDIKMEDIERQQAILMTGYRGVSMKNIADEWYVCYKK
ncbi:GNAT family N-acetyltransferase [Oceanobacillus sp. CF4.6]|uniref:GNAT family N-acetyltransferase n=1 Tax=Oceanobacillus sp. CF4.6 TaxID=3373080 RepID=UPI003EE7FFDA